MEGLMIGAEQIIPTIDMAVNMPRPRIIKSHLPKFLLPQEMWKVKPKV